MISCRTRKSRLLAELALLGTLGLLLGTAVAGESSVGSTPPMYTSAHDPLSLASSPPPLLASSRGGSATRDYSVVVRTYNENYSPVEIASIKTTALLILYNLTSGTNQLVLFNAAVNSSVVVQSVVRGGKNVDPSSIVTADGAFFLSWFDSKTGLTFWEKVTTSGKISYPDLPLGQSLSWFFVGGSGDALYAADGSLLVEINATSFQTIANYSKSIPSSVAISTVLPVGDRIYIGGSRAVTANTTSPYFGFLNVSSAKVTTVSKVLKNLPPDVYGGYGYLAMLGTYVYVAGALSTVDFSTDVVSTDAGYFYRYDPATSTFTNRSALLPNQSWGVFGLEPWGSTLALSLTGYANFLGFTPIEGGVYTLSGSGSKLLNQSDLFPSGYIPYYMTSASSGWFFSASEFSYPPLAAAVKT